MLRGCPRTLKTPNSPPLPIGGGCTKTRVPLTTITTFPDHLAAHSSRLTLTTATHHPPVTTHHSSPITRHLELGCAGGDTKGGRALAHSARGMSQKRNSAAHIQRFSAPAGAETVAESRRNVARRNIASQRRPPAPARGQTWKRGKKLSMSSFSASESPSFCEAAAFF